MAVVGQQRGKPQGFVLQGHQGLVTQLLEALRGTRPGGHAGVDQHEQVDLFRALHAQRATHRAVNLGGVTTAFNLADHRVQRGKIERL